MLLYVSGNALIGLVHKFLFKLLLLNSLCFLLNSIILHVLLFLNVGSLCITVTHLSPLSQNLGTPEPDSRVEQEGFRPAEEERFDLMSPPLLPSIRRRVTKREKESLQESVLRIACNIAVRRESKRVYATRRKQDKFKCKLCGVFLNSAASREAHLQGKGHQRRMKRAKEGPKSCSYCNGTVRSQRSGIITSVHKTTSEHGRSNRD